MNKIIIKGRLTRDVEIKTVSESNVANFTVAVNRRFNRNETDFFECQAWRNTADFIARYFSKGQEILVEGEMQQRKWQDQDGNNRYAWSLNAENVEFCGSKTSQTQGFEPAPQIGDDDDLPF